MKGIGKALARTPFAVTSKIGMSKKSVDAEFDDYQRHFASLEKAAESLLKDTKAFLDAVTTLFMAEHNTATHFTTIFSPISGEYDLIGKNPEAAHTIRNVTKYETAMEELLELIRPELELIETRICGPVKELQSVMKTIRKSITKRDHKLTDYDRFNNSLTKLRDKKDKSLSDEKNLFKLEQDFEVATNEYDYINNALKQDLPRFMMLSTQFIDPLFNSLFYMHALQNYAENVWPIRLNIYYLLLEKMNSFAEECKYDISNVPGAQIAQDYENNRTDAWNVIESLGIIKRIVSVSRLVQQTRANSGNTTTLGRQPSTATTSSVASSATGLRAGPPPTRAASYTKPAPAPPVAQAAPPPPYTATGSAASAAAAKRAPPPPPPLKPKPKPQVTYVVALYDFVAQADGDLSFNSGDRIELVEKTDSAEDWWTGKLNGVQGVFPVISRRALMSGVHKSSSPQPLPVPKASPLPLSTGPHGLSNDAAAPQTAAPPPPAPRVQKPRPTLRPTKAALTITSTAITRLRNLLDGPTPQLIRIGVRNKGCAGLSYHLDYVEKPDKFDEVVKQDGVRVLIDSKALFSIIGSEMDWKEDALSSKFVFKNPNIKDACGCGESFNVAGS
ncbi:hypothetical protein D9619_003107 [Psilocybe cf. subviscida]|uniref:Iron-sulfur assembly protein 1 n=1 Tax=Psilocybe cf. subviscida TaxID=2480587 RepID=A0A8H5AYA8_9AGAR|nr:hypothetical protein D9619_003107 [Psilocybe cf. subviscida]